MTKTHAGLSGSVQQLVTPYLLHHDSRKASSAYISIHRGHAGLSSFQVLTRMSD